MSKFKVGDRVRLVCNFNAGALGTVIGHPQEISQRAYLGAYVRRDRGGNTDCLYYTDNELELIMNEKPKPHVHAELIKAWADGAKIQKLHGHSWADVKDPSWSTECDYRIKPEIKPDKVLTRSIRLQGHCIMGRNESSEFEDNCKFTFDGETGKLKAVEII